MRYTCIWARCVCEPSEISLQCFDGRDQFAARISRHSCDEFRFSRSSTNHTERLACTREVFAEKAAKTVRQPNQSRSEIEDNRKSRWEPLYRKLEYVKRFRARLLRPDSDARCERAVLPKLKCCEKRLCVIKAASACINATTTAKSLQ